MSKLTQRESEVVRWILSEVDARDAAEPRPASRIDIGAWVIAVICASFVAVLLLLAVGAYIKAW